MSKTKMAEWLAENVLEWKLAQHDYWYEGSIAKKGKSKLIEFIYSPKGFFAVWDAVEEKVYSTRFRHIKHGGVKCTLSNLDEFKHHYTTSYGEDRYEAFYNAVYEGMNEKINTNS